MISVMKRIMTIVSIVGLMVFSSCSQKVDAPEVSSDETTEAKVVYAANEEVDVAIDGMMCSMGCKGAIEKELNNTAGVAECSVDFENGTAHIAFDNSVINKQEITETINSVNDGAYKATLKTQEAESGTELENSEA